MSKRRRIKLFLLLCGDIAVLYLALYAGLLIRYPLTAETGIIAKHFGPFTAVFVLWLLVFGAFGFYELRLMRNSRLFLLRLLRIMATNTGLAIILFYFARFEIEPRRNLLLIAVLATAFIFLWRYLFNILIIHTPVLRVILFGTNSEMVELALFLKEHPQLGHKPVAFVTIDEGTPELPFPLPLPHYSLAGMKLRSIINETRAESVIISRELKADKAAVRILFDLIPLGISVTEFPAFHEMATGKVPLSLIEEAWFLENLIGIRKRLYEFTKRMLDILGSLLFGSIAAITFPLVAAAIKLDSPGDIVFRQKRVGRHGREFTLVKYRSMIVDAEAVGGFKTAGTGTDARVTRIGALLRKTYLDELPQLINIFKGEMSFVGPRPERPRYVRELKQRIPFYEMRTLVTPGLTGWAQIHMENDASVEDAPEKMQYDLYYIKNRSAVLDLLIILRTLAAIVRRQGR